MKKSDDMANCMKCHKSFMKSEAVTSEELDLKMVFCSHDCMSRWEEKSKWHK